MEEHTSEGPAATMTGYKGRFKDDPVYDTDRMGELTSMWSDHRIGRPENLMTGVSFARGGYHRIGKRVTNGLGGYTVHRADHWLFDGTGIGYGDVLGAGATVVGYECDGCAFTYRDGLPHPMGEDGTPMSFEILGTAPAAHFTRTTSQRPPKPHEPAETNSSLAGSSEPAIPRRSPASTMAMPFFGTYTSPGGGVVVTSGSNRLGPRPRAARPADRADHPQRDRTAGVTGGETAEHRRRHGETDLATSGQRPAPAPAPAGLARLAGVAASRPSSAHRSIRRQSQDPLRGARRHQRRCHLLRPARLRGDAVPARLGGRGRLLHRRRRQCRVVLPAGFGRSGARSLAFEPSDEHAVGYSKTWS